MKAKPDHSAHSYYLDGKYNIMTDYVAGKYYFGIFDWNGEKAKPIFSVWSTRREFAAGKAMLAWLELLGDKP
jgi:hypothetical protein